MKTNAGIFACKRPCVPHAALFPQTSPKRPFVPHAAPFLQTARTERTVLRTGSCLMVKPFNNLRNGSAYP